MMSMTILLADDHSLFLEGLQNLLIARNMPVVGIARDGFEALALARSLRPHVVLMDIQMPRCNGLEATRLLKRELPETQIVILTMSADDQHLFEAVKAGACGYLLKSLNSEQFFDLLAGLARGEAPMTRDLAAKILVEFAQQAHKPAPLPPSTSTPDSLTERQLEVLRFLAQGRTNQEIATALFITERTVKYHTREILQKLHLRNRAQVIAYAARAGLSAPSAPSYA